MIDIVARAEAAIARVEALGDEAGRIFTRFDARRILAEAERLRTRAAGNGPAMPLYGLIISIKDLFDERGEVTSAGSLLLREAPAAARDAEAVRRLKDAGALMFGRTTMSEFAYSGVGLNPHYGTPGNAVDRTRIPGGSTSGGALTVAHGLCDAALGTDTGGSVRIPAAANGLCGYKPSQACVPLGGVHPLSVSLDSAGPLAAEMETAILVHETLSGGMRPAAAPERPLRLALPVNAFVDEADDFTQAHFARSRAALRAAGHALVEVDFGFLGAAVTLNRVIVAAEAHALYRDRLDELETVGDPRVLGRIRFAETLAPGAHEVALAERAGIAARFAEAMSGFDALIAPTLALKPPTIAEAEAEFDRINALMLRNCSLVNLADGCAMTVPVAGDGVMPGNLMIAGPNRADAHVLAVSEIVRAAVAGR